MTKTPLLAAAALLLATPAIAQTAPAPATVQAATSTPVDPARLAAAQALVNTLFPPAVREQMMRGMLVPIGANVRESLISDYHVSAAATRDPRAQKIIDNYVEGQLANVQREFIATIPQMTSAFARAFARRLDISQMEKAQAFFSSQAGRQYRQVATTIMSDPDVVAWQRDMLDKVARQSMRDIKTLSAELTALSAKSSSQ